MAAAGAGGRLASIPEEQYKIGHIYNIVVKDPPKIYENMILQSSEDNDEHGKLYGFSTKDKRTSKVVSQKEILSEDVEIQEKKNVYTPKPSLELNEGSIREGYLNVAMSPYLREKGANTYFRGHPSLQAKAAAGNAGFAVRKILAGKGRRKTKRRHVKKRRTRRRR